MVTGASHHVQGLMWEITMKARILFFVCGVLMSLGVWFGTVGDVKAVTCFFPDSETQCNSGWYISYRSRPEAISHGYAYVNEPYSTFGGWIVDNNGPSTPNPPSKGNEGADCSGLVFKSWAMRYTRGELGWWY